MKSLKLGKMLKKVLSVVVILSMLSMPVFATTPTVETNPEVFTVPEFSVIIGNSVFEMNWANNVSNESSIMDAIINSTGDIYVQTFKGTWFSNTTGNEIDTSELTGLLVVSFNGVQMSPTQIELPVVDDIPEEPVQYLTTSGIPENDTLVKNEKKNFIFNGAGIHEGNISIKYNLDGEFKSDWVDGGTVVVDTSIVGEHMITLDITDNSNGLNNIYYINYTVKEEEKAETMASYTGIDDGQVVLQNSEKILNVEPIKHGEYDVDTQVVVDGLYLDGFYTTGGSVTLPTGDLGLHTIVIDSMDILGEVGNQITIYYNVVQTEEEVLPTVTIEGLDGASNNEFQLGESVEVIIKTTGTVFYLVDGYVYLDGYQTFGYSHSAGQTTKYTLDTSMLGIHELVFTCTDSSGIKGKDIVIDYTVIPAVK